MITRVLATLVVVALGIYAFWGDAMGQGHVLNPFGILFLLLAALIWFGWGPIREGFKSAKDERVDDPKGRFEAGWGTPPIRFLNEAADTTAASTRRSRRQHAGAGRAG